MKCGACLTCLMSEVKASYRKNPKNNKKRLRPPKKSKKLLTKTGASHKKILTKTTKNSGQITAADLKVALSKIGEPATDAEVEGMMLEAGVEKDEYITFSHFKELCKRLSLI
ncbi:uncharacterized protein [Diabrotica undecimpunctata]|uniref:uncharacterized protein isoform X2 n=1 Tax=Diabrotica undecimpunctata TaxID=50387 RepID=UPI003B6426E4